MDTARADAFEPYGAAVGSSPVVADLARRGTTAERMRSTACWTLPAHLSMFTGKLPRALGFTDQAGLLPDNARPAVEALEDRMLANVLRRAGYATGAVSANLWVSPRSGFSVGFDRFAEAMTKRQARMVADARRDRLAWLWESGRGRVDDGARSAEVTLHDWVREPPDQPFFWFVNLLECHSPYLPPRPYGDAGWRTRLRAADEARDYLTMVAVWRACVTRRMPPEDALERMRALYRGCIRYMDDWLGRLLAALDAQGLLDDTLVLVTSDHGENFGEGGLLAHSMSLDDRLLHVPAVAAGPGAEHFAGLGSVAELPRALAAVAGIEDHPYRDDDLPGVAVAQFDPPVRPPDDPRTAKAIREWELDEEGVARLTSPMIAAADGDLKLVVRGDVEAFYALEADPLEARPLQADAVDPAAAQRLRDALAHPGVTAAHTTWSASPDAAPPAAPQDVADLEDRMRLLGYL
jgi:arylsulfatase A-like enzyme